MSLTESRTVHSTLAASLLKPCWLKHKGSRAVTDEQLDAILVEEAAKTPTYAPFYWSVAAVRAMRRAYDIGRQDCEAELSAANLLK